MKIRRSCNGDGQNWNFIFKTAILVIFLALIGAIDKGVSGDAKYTDYCLSVNKELGKCVPLSSCPLFLGWVRQRPIVKTNLRLVVKFTCFFDLAAPRVCCPVTKINKESNLISDKSLFNNGPSSLISIRKLKPTPPSVLLFPSETPVTTTGPSTRRKQKIKQFNKFQLLPELKDCSNPIRLDRIVGTYGTHPWIALIGSINAETGRFEHSCTGTIINRRYVLTSAHCPYESIQTLTTVRVGDYNIDTDIDRGSIYLPQSIYKEYGIQKIIPHLGFNRIRRTNDIAVVRVDQNIDFNSTFIRPICLPFVKGYGLSSILKIENLNEGVDKKALVAGWGKTTWNSSPIDVVLREGPVQFSPFEECENAFQNAEIVQTKQICVGGKRRLNSCVIDSGGPLLAPLKINATNVPGIFSAKVFQLGILSLGPSSEQCDIDSAMSLQPSLYTKVSSYLDWILNSLEP